MAFKQRSGFTSPVESAYTNSNEVTNLEIKKSIRFRVSAFKSAYTVFTRYETGNWNIDPSLRFTDTSVNKNDGCIFFTPDVSLRGIPDTPYFLRNWGHPA
jgi:hypothetical protein